MKIPRLNNWGFGSPLASFAATPVVALLAAFFLSPNAEKSEPAAEIVPMNVVQASAKPEVLPLGPIVEAPVAQTDVAPAIPELPRGMKAVVNSKGGTKSVTLVHQGHLVVLRRGDVVVLGENSATLPLKEPGDISWESLDRKTFAMLRGALNWESQTNGKDKPILQATASVEPSRSITSGRHECRAFEATAEPMTVICRVDSLTAGAVRVFGKKPQDGIAMAEVGEHRYFRADLDASKETFDSVVIGYSDGARGHVIRAEASKLPGETKASYSFLAASRAQPIVIRRFHRHHDPPHPFDTFL